MLNLTHLQTLATLLRGDKFAPSVGRTGWLIHRLIARIQTIEPDALDELTRATRGLQPTVSALLQTAADNPRLDASEVRDLTTVYRRLATILAHVGSPPGVDRLDADAMRVVYARIELASVLSHVCACFSALAIERSVDYEVSIPAELVAEVDVRKLELAVGNALFNAFKYTPEGGVVRCTVSIDELLQDVVITVEDSGPGVDPTQLDEIFHRSREADRSVATCLGPVRLSLGLSRDMIALHGGVLDTVPTTTGHALFEIRLPRWAPVGAPLHEAPRSPSSWLPEAAALAASELRAEAELGVRPVADDGRPMVLVIVGSRSLNRAVVGCLEPDYATASAFEADAGLELAASLRPDLVVVDLDQMGSSGEDLIRHLGVQSSDSAILAITRNRDEPQVLRLLEAGVQDIMPKPVLLAELWARARRLIAAKRAQDVLSDAIGQRDTDLIALANEVADKHHDLERAYSELEMARARAERMNEAKSNFLRIVSHELKTPVTAMKLQLSVLENDPQLPRTPVLDRGLERIARSARRLLDLVDTMLEWARVEDGRYTAEVEPFEIADLAEEVAARLDTHARVRDTELIIEDERLQPHPLVNDRRLVRLVLINLVERAISVSSDARVVIRMTESALAHHVHVHDASPPLNEEQRAEVFDPIRRTRDFHRLSGTGSGIGVYAIRDIARAVGGEIRWERDGDTGNTFVFDIPSRLPGATIDLGPQPNAVDAHRVPQRTAG